MSPARILVIDDEPGVIMLCQRALEEQGFEVKGALNGEEGLQLLRAGQVDNLPYDLALLDIRLPDCDGLDMLPKIWEVDPEMVVAIITGYATMEVAIRALKLGAQDFLLKPFTPEELLVSVQKILEKKRLVRENLRLKTRLPILEISKALMSEVNLDRLALLALETVQQTLEADRVSLMLLDEERQELSISAALGLPDEIVTTTRVKVGQGLASLVTQRKRPILLPEHAKDDLAIQALLTRSDIGSSICLPVMVKDCVLGVLNVSRAPGGASFRQDDVDLLSILGGQIAVSIENAQLYESLSQQGEQLRTLAARLAETEEAERQRLSRELHDQVGQNLTALGINLNIVRSQIPEGAADLVRSRLDDSLVLVEQTTERIRNVMAELRPPVLDDYGLMAALRWYGAQFSSRASIAVTVEGEELVPRLVASVENALFRIAQEALINVTKHAQATQVTVTVGVDGETVRLTVADDGIGFDPTRPAERDGRRGWGLLTMAERAEAVGGRCWVESCPGEGTQVIVEVPR